MKKIRATWRLLNFVFWTFYHLVAIILKEKFNTPSLDRRNREKMLWARRMERLLGMEIEVSGKIPDKGVLITPNHRSYIDVVPVVKYIPGIYLAKAEVRKWPLIGYGATFVDTLWIQRDQRESRQENRRKIAQALLEGKTVVVHPEGTTVAAPDMNDFRPGIFYSCASEGLPVVPVAIEFKYGPDAWIGADTFLPHFMSCFGKKKTPIRIHFGPELHSDQAEDLRIKAQEWVRQELVKMREIMDWQENYPD